VVVLLGAWLGGNPWAAYGVAVLCLVQWLHFIALERSFVAFPVQVRGGFLLMLLGGFWEPLRFLHWVQLVGTTAFLTLGYCLLARLLSLLPWNRKEPLTGRLVALTLFSRPQAGNVLQGMPTEPAPLPSVTTGGA
jgi:hypothetical protein